METNPVWRAVDYDEAWSPFDRAFEFVANPYEREAPAIRLPADALVIDLKPIFGNPGPRFAAGEDAVNASGFRSFVWLTDCGDLTALDWHHTSYRYSPARHVLSEASPAVPIFPNGDYYAHMPLDLRWGTFGHPWQHTLTIWGEELRDTLGAELLTWLPRHPQSRT